MSSLRVSVDSVDVDINRIPNVRRIENFAKQEMQALAMDLTHAVYPHDQIYGKYCTIQEYIACEPREVYRYLTDVYTLEEWTYSLRDFEPVTGSDGVFLSWDKIGGKTRIFTKVVAHPEAMTVDYHCSWDQGEKLWMIYLMRVVPAELVFDRPGSVVLWTNCHHPFYDANPYPEKAPSDRKIWVGDMWPFFYAGHTIEMQNLKHILEHRQGRGLPLNPREGRR